MADGLGEALISRCLDVGSFVEAAHLGVDGEMLRDSAASAWQFSLDLCRAKAFPTRDELETRFDLVLPKTEETIESLCRRIRDRAYLDDLRPIFEDSLRLVKEGNPQEAVEAMLKAGKLRAKYAPKARKVLGYKADFEERILQYKLLKASGGILGAVSRWPTLNRTMKGWQDGLLHILAAMTGVGKSWLLMVLCDDLLNQERRPLIVSTEMQPIRLQFRLDCIRYRVPFPMLRDGDLPSDEEVEWMKQMHAESEDLSSDATFVGRDDVRSVSDVQLMAQELDATDVLIDGGYRLSQSREWGDQAQVVQDLQLAAQQSNVPWIVTTQLGDSSESGKSFARKAQPKWRSRYAKEWEIDPDVVIYASQTDDMKQVGQMGLALSKWRDGDGDPVEWAIHWDPKTMNYDEASAAETVAAAAADAPAVLVLTDLGDDDDD